MRRARTFKQAAEFVDHAGMALVFPKQDIPLPSLWGAVAGDRPVQWIDHRDDDGTIVYDRDIGKVWSWKDRLAEEKVACAGKHVRGWPSLISRKLLPSWYSLTGRSGTPDDFRKIDLSNLETEIAEVVLENGALTAPDVRGFLGTKETARVNRAIDSLQKHLVLTRAGIVDQEHGWPASSFQILSERYRAWLRSLPGSQEALDNLAVTVLGSAGDLSAAELAASVGWPRKRASDVLNRLVQKGRAQAASDEGVPIWRAAHE